MADRKPDLEFTRVDLESEIPKWTSWQEIVEFFHNTMKPWDDTIESIERAMNYAFSDAKGEGGFLILAHRYQKLIGALLMLNTGMSGYVPENLLLFVTVDPDQRGKGYGAEIIRHSVAECKGDVKLHVEYENPAKRLYERLGFTNKYAEMRLKR
jgi:ribosomal-protein-alanine N-acetyltransferase